MSLKANEPRFASPWRGEGGAPSLSPASADRSAHAAAGLSDLGAPGGGVSPQISPPPGGGEDKRPNLQVVTLGCRLNAFESEVMRANAIAAGLEDAVIVNTCAVTAEAVRQAGQTIRKLRRENPSARLIVTGCAAQIEPQRFAAMPEVDGVIGNVEKMRPETFLASSLAGSPRIAVNDIMSVRETAHAFVGGFGASGRAYVEVQNGCDHRCTFCIIPFGRGPSRSVPAGEVVAGVRKLVEAGCAEIVLTGVDITDYGTGLPGEMTLGKLVRHILRQVLALRRLRLSSIDQVEADRDLIAAIADEPRLMPHLHLSLQAGDDVVLKRMKRRHSRADAIRFCEQARRLRPDIVFGADLIAGFPTETEAMFEGSLRLVADCGLTFLHVFPYSPRPGTPAARMPQVARAAVKERAARLRQEGNAALGRHLQSQIGAEVELLIERRHLGRTPQFAEMELAQPSSPGRVVLARITASDGKRLRGELLAPKLAT